MYIRSETFVMQSLGETPEELAQVLDVYRQCEDFLALGPAARATPEMVQADLALSRREGGIFCGIYRPEDGRMLGVVDFVVSGFDGDPGLASLILLMIAAPFRGQGLGEAVVHAVEALIRQDGRARAIDSGVQVNNPAAIRFWRRMGYKIVSGARQMEDGTVAYHLIRVLASENQDLA
jgi:ribosomal protein S18 acetylase RimI-like enzyme